MVKFKTSQICHNEYRYQLPLYWTTLHVGVQIKACHLKNFRFRYATLSFESKTNPTKIYQDIYCLLPL
ncbi:hypothetical protein ACTXT7_011945 [Hymenolepis weldensis]